jgi:bifunctional non-homologous end joining protein LigD
MTSLTFGRYTVAVSNADKLLFPESGVSKIRLIEYYQQVAEAMLPHLRDRPVMMHRFPDGIQQEGFYQKQIGDYFPEWIDRIEVPKQGGTTTHVVCNNTATLVYLANQACITPHAWLSRTDHLHHPDRLIFDLDPPDGEFEPVRFAAYKLKDLLDELGMPGFVATTGSRGLHVVTPLDRSAEFDEVRSLARDLAGLLASREPQRLTVEVRKDKRGGRLYLDVGRNAYAQTAVAPYAVRALPRAPVATPLDWDELRDSKLHAQSYTIESLPRRLAQKPDPWSGLQRHAVSLTKARERLNAINTQEKEP